MVCLSPIDTQNVVVSVLGLLFPVPVPCGMGHVVDQWGDLELSGQQGASQSSFQASVSRRGVGGAQAA